MPDNSDLATSEKTWKRPRGWTSSWPFWPGDETVTMGATQVPYTDDPLGLTCLVDVTLIINGEVVLELKNASWVMPQGEPILLLQIYLLSQEPNSPHAEWQPLMEEFCHLHEGFEPPHRLWWVEGRWEF